MKKKVYAAMAITLALAGCGKDSIETVCQSAVDDVEQVDFSRTVTVSWNSDGSAAVSGVGDGQTVSGASSGRVTIVNSGSEVVEYRLSGTSSNGCFKVYSAAAQSVVLEGLDLTNPTGAAINMQGPADAPADGETTYIVLIGSNSLSDGTSYSETPDDEDEKGTLFGEGSLVFSGSGTLTVAATGKSGVVSDDWVKMLGGSVAVNATSSVRVSGTDTTKVSAVKAKDGFVVSDGALTVVAAGTGCKGISGDGTAEFAGGTVSVTVSGANYGGSSGGGGMFGGGSSSSNGVKAKGIKFDDAIVFSGASVSVKCANHEGIESKSTITVSGGEVYSYASDDAINSASTMTIGGGYLCAHSSGNDGIDANGNVYIKGGVVYAIGASSPEVAVDANTEESYKLYVQGGTLVAIGGLESGAELSQTCYSSSSWSSGTWYGLTVGSTTYAFKTPSSGGSGLVVSGSSTPSLKSGVSISGGDSYFSGTFYADCTASGGTTVSLSQYSDGNGGGNGGGPGGGGRP